MMDLPTRRKFLPEPVETSTRSSKRPHHEHPSRIAHVRFETVETELPVQSQVEPRSPPSKPRRLLPQPVEESTWSLRKARAASSEKSTEQRPEGDRCSEVNGAESKHTVPSGRRFAPEPVQTSARSSRKKFTPQPVETSTRRSRPKHKQEKDNRTPSPSWKRFLPEPLETTPKRRQRPRSPEDEDSSRSPSPPSRSSSGGRRFTPELLETARGSYRRSKLPLEQQGSDKLHTERSHDSGTDTKTAHKVPDVTESRFSAASLAKRQHVERQHSFRVPKLPIIDSGDSDESDTPSLSDSKSDSSNVLSRPQTRTLTDNYTEYVLNLASQKELEDQAMAAYINERPHQPVDHFAIAHDDDEDGPVHVGKFSGENGATAHMFRRDSASDLRLELANLRKHHEELEAAKRDLKDNTAGASRFSSAALMARHHIAAGSNLKKRDSTKTRIRKGMLRNAGADPDTEGPDEDAEIRRMRRAASPPMAGDDLYFPLTVSPKMTRCDTDHAPRPRTAEVDDENDENVSAGEEGLWKGNSNVSDHSSAGLWMGMCQRDSDQPSRPTTPTRSGIQTPAYSPMNPADALTPGPTGRLTPGKSTPGRPKTRGGGAAGMLSVLSFTALRPQDGEDAFTSSIDKKLMLEKQIDDEFPNQVITQIYNYLSLGYPSLAHPFDAELAKISKLSIEDIRKDDETQDAKGYVGAPEGECVDEDFVVGGDRGGRGGCRRWEALRLYVREWARQSPGFRREVGGLGVGLQADGGAWGARARRGSWAH